MTKTTEPVIVQTPAKLNLGLRVIRRRADGYHDLLTTFLAVDWTDRLTVSVASRPAGRDAEEPDQDAESAGRGGARADSGSAAVEARVAMHGSAPDSMTCSDPSIPSDESNLCLRAIRALRTWAADRSTEGSKDGATDEATERETKRAVSRSALVPLHVDLEKNIPAGAGLGGGSSDAAATLLSAAKLWGLDVPKDDMLKIAAGLGADVPFFLNPSPQLATGIGDRLRPLTARPGLPMEHILIVVPDVHVSTAEAYSGVTPRPLNTTHSDGRVTEADGRRLAAAFVSTDPAVWRRDLVNDFEASVFERYPVIARIKQQMLDAGALHASMSGSGSAVFGIFQTGHDISAAESGLGAHEGLTLRRVRALT